MSLDPVLRKELRSCISGSVLFDEPLDRHTSMKVGGPADVLAFPQSKEELIRLINLLHKENIPCLLLGNGTNLIVRDGGCRGVVISLQGLKKLTQTPLPENKISLRAEAGVPLATVVKLSVAESFTGMEFCAGIPGSIGGAVRMNAGAFGKEMKDVLTGITLLNEERELDTKSRRDLFFEYRRLDLAKNAVIVEAEFILSAGDQAGIAEKVNALKNLRKRKHPLNFHNAGSIFKNPHHVSAGQIIEEAGLKGTRRGDAMVSELHGNFIVNLGNARTADILELMEEIKNKVRICRDIDLEAEVHVVGEDA